MSKIKDWIDQRFIAGELHKSGLEIQEEERLLLTFLK